MSQIVQQFLVVLFGSGAAIAIANLIFQHRRESKIRSDAAIYLAIQLSFQLEAYVIRCANAATDNSTAEGSDGHAGEYIGAVPIFDPLPESSSYQYLNATVLSAVFDLPQRRDMAQEAGMFYWNMLADADATRGALEEHTIRMALATLEVADLIRASYPIGKRDLTFGKWNLREYLNEKMGDIHKREEREKRHAREMAQNIPSPPPD